MEEDSITLVVKKTEDIQEPLATFVIPRSAIHLSKVWTNLFEMDSQYGRTQNFSVMIEKIDRHILVVFTYFFIIRLAEMIQ